jgi:ribosomal protein S18 acetylase RimI-like enzyme
MISSYVSKDELAAIVPLVNAAYRGEVSKQGWTTEANIVGGEKRTDLQQLLDLLSDPQATLMKITDESGSIVGSVFLRNHFEDGLYLGMLSVWPHLQAKGIGRMLMMAAEAHARQLGCNRIFMNVISVRNELIAWYQKLGYTITPERKPFPNDSEYGYALQPLEFIVMEKWF